MPATTQTYTVELATEAGANPSAWTAITPYVKRFSFRRGRDDVLLETQPGTCSLVLDNSDGRFSPAKTSSPLYPHVQAMRAVRIRTALAGVAGDEGASDYLTAVTADGPLGYWRLGEAAGTTATDASGNGHDGTYTGGVTLGQPGATGDGDPAVLFDGVAGTHVPATLGADPTAGDRLTIEAWVRGTAWSASYEMVLSLANGATYLAVVNGQPTFSAYLNGAQQLVTGPSALPTDQWVHLAAVWDGASQRLYVDGAEVVSAARTGPLTGTPGLLIGAWYDLSLGFSGALDEVAVYNTALSAERVAAHSAAAGDEPYPTAVLADAPLRYYRLGEPSGTTATDASGAGHHGTYTGGVTLGQPGALVDGGTAAAFDGVDDQVVVPHHAALDLTGDLTLEAWVKPTDRATYQMLVTKCVGTGAANNTFEWRLALTSGLPQFIQYTGSPQAANASTAPAVGEWSHVAVVKAGTTVTHYRNGAVSGTGTCTGAVTTNSSSLRVGARDDLTASHFFLGALDEVAVYGTALSAARIAAHYAAASAGPPRRRFLGYIQSVRPRVRLDEQECVLDLADGSAWLALAKTTPVYGSVATGTAIGTALDSAAWPAALRNLDTAITSVTPAYADQPVLSQVNNLAVQNEGGVFFFDGQGRATFHNRHKRYSGASLTAQAAFSTTGTLRLADLVSERPARDIANEVAVTYLGDGVATQTDAASQTAYGPRRLDLDAQWLTANEASARAEWALLQRKDPADRPVVTVLGRSDTVLAQILTRELGDRITVTGPTVSGVSGDFHLEGVAVDADASTLVERCVWQLSPATTLAYLTLDEATLGRLDTNPLAP